MPSTITDRLNGLTTSVAIKAPCIAATTAPITLSGEQDIDGVAFVSGHRILVKDQASASENGIWIASSTDWTRAPDFDGSLDAVGGTTVYVISGATNVNTYWRVDGTDTSVYVGTDAIEFVPALLSDSATIAFLQGGDGAVERTVQDRLRETVSCADFGATGENVFDPVTYYDSGSPDYLVFNGTHDDTPGMVAFFEYCLETGKSGYIPEGNYWVDWGAIDLDNGGVMRPFPAISTAGVEAVRFIGRGDVDAPMIKLTNGTVGTAGIHTWKGGGIYNGFSVFNLDDKVGAVDRSALKMWGCEKIWFGPIFGRGLQGHVVHVPEKTNELEPPPGHNPDPYHVYSCTFEMVEGWFCEGYTFKNQNAIGLVGNTFFRVREIANDGGCFYGWGANNDVFELSSGASFGTVLHDGTDVEIDFGAPFNFTLNRFELDGPANGIFIGRAKHVRMAGRIVHRNQGGVYVPAVGVQFGAGVDSDADDIDLYIINDVRGPVGGTTKADVGDFFNFNNTASCPNDTYINTKLIDNAGYSPAIVAEDMYVDLHPLAKVRMDLQGKTFVDQTGKGLFSATHSTTSSVVPITGYGSSASIITFDNESFDRGNDYSPSTYAFTAPASGQALVSISLALSLAAGTRVRLGLLEYNSTAGTYGLTAAGKTSHQGLNSVTQHHTLTRFVPVFAGRTYSVTADQNSTSPVSLTPAFNNAESCFQMSMA